MASARIVPGLPSGSNTTNSSSPFNRLNPYAANNLPNNGCDSAVTRTSHGNSDTKMLQSVAFTPGTGKTHLAIGLGVKAAQAGYSVLFDTASNWITRLRRTPAPGNSMPS